VAANAFHKYPCRLQNLLHDCSVGNIINVFLFAVVFASTCDLSLSLVSGVSYQHERNHEPHA
jgi:hypothetical protein